MRGATNRAEPKPLPRTMTDGLEIIRVPAVDARLALRLTLSAPGQTAAELEQHVSGFVEFARRMGLDLSRQWMVRRGGRAVSACTCIESPGRTVMVFLPDSGRVRAEGGALDRLLAHVLAEYKGRDIRLAQSLIDPDDHETRRALEAAGFFEIAELAYMEADVLRTPRRFEPPRPKTPAVEWEMYSPARHAVFRDFIARTYEGSLDCPKLAGLRDMEDVIAGHKGAGLFDPARWLLAVHDRRPAGCILLGENPLRPAAEIVYMAVDPAMRGRGLGRVLLNEGFRVAHVAHLEKVTLAVDAANVPAWQLYRSFGFTVTTRRRAMIRAISSTSDES